MYLLKPVFVIVYRFHHLWKSESILTYQGLLEAKISVVQEAAFKVRQALFGTI